MPTSTTKPEIDLHQLLSLPQKKLSRSALRKLDRKRRQYHVWTYDELSLIAYLRLHKRWPWGQIHKRFFTSISINAVQSTYLRLSHQERARRALRVSTLTDTDNVWNEDSDLFPRSPSAATSLREQPVSGPWKDIGPETGDNATARYNLRRNRPKNFQKEEPIYRIDRGRFPHFSRACEDISKVDAQTDEDYVPPAYSPTPDPSERSPSIISSVPSDASSLDLFGLEVRSVSPSEPQSPRTPFSSDSEFFSAKEDSAST